MQGRNFSSAYHSISFHQTYVNTAIYTSANVLINLLNSQLQAVFSRQPRLTFPKGVLLTDFVKRLKNDRCFHELD